MNTYALLLFPGKTMSWGLKHFNWKKFTPILMTVTKLKVSNWPYDVTTRFSFDFEKLKTNSTFYRVFSPTFKTVLETVCVVELMSNYRNFRYLNGQLVYVMDDLYILVCGHIRHQRCQIQIKLHKNRLKIIVLN